MSKQGFLPRRRASFAVALAVLLGAPVSAPVSGQQASITRSDGINMPVCRRENTARNLPAELRETSGLAASLLRDDVLWTHNDRGNAPELFAINGDGEILQRIRLDVTAEDWEDIEIAACGDESCIFVADTGDNDGERERITVYRLKEPDPDSGEVGAVDALHARFPDGPRDVEALFVLPGERLFLISKGRREDIALYRFPSLRPDTVVTLQHVRTLFPEPDDGDDRVTAATATRDGRLVGIRTKRSLYVHVADELLTNDSPDPFIISLAPLAESQGEGLAMAGNGHLWFSSEADGREGNPTLNQLICDWPHN